MSKKIEILCTLGPASMNDAVISRLEELGATLFRINLSHTKLDQVADAVRFIQERTVVPVCLDSEGAQVRTGDLPTGPVTVQENGLIKAHAAPTPAAAEPGDISLHPGIIVGRLRIGDMLRIDFNSVLAQVIGFDGDAAVLRVLNGGLIGDNKAVTIDPAIALPAMTEKDRQAVVIGLGLGVRNFALSFANCAEDVAEMRAAIGADATLISKIESRQGLRNLEKIAHATDALLIDRGDLSREVPIERIPFLQKQIIASARDAGRKVYVATNLLESMVSAPSPTRAEVNDIFNTLGDGADGLVLAAETAIGEYPIQCASMIVKMIHEAERKPEPGHLLDDAEPVSLLVPPHGGKLIQQEIEAPDVNGLESLPRLTVGNADLMDCAQLGLGTYSPLSGFMNKETLESVLTDNCLPDGTVWTMPVILQIDPGDADRLSGADRIALTGKDGVISAVLHLDEIYQVQLDDMCRRWFGTDSAEHPGVARILAAGNTLAAGKVFVVERGPSAFRHYELTPAQTRFIFTHKGWNRVVGFHTRNAIHRVHEFIQLEALRRTGADGLFISPVIGPKKPNDFLPDPVMKSYQLTMAAGAYPAGKVVLGSFATYSRYCGPREAVFTALCRKNMGCSHFIIGRDHTGVGDFYAPDANTQLFEQLGDIGITPVFFDSYGFDPVTESYRAASEGAALESISGTSVRAALRAGDPLPDWFMRDIVQDMLHQEIAAGRPIFHE